MTVIELDCINHYLSGNLSEEERSAVESRMLRDSEFRAEVELSRELREGLADLRATGELDDLAAHRASLWQRPAFGLAASALAVLASLVALASYQKLTTLRQRLETVASVPSIASPSAPGVEVLRFVQTRGAAEGSELTWQFDPTVGRLDLHFDVGLEPAASYSLELSLVGEGGDALVLSAPSVAVTDGEVSLALNPALLQPGTYAVTLEDATHGAWHYRFKVTAHR